MGLLVIESWYRFVDRQFVKQRNPLLPVIKQDCPEQDRLGTQNMFVQVQVTDAKSQKPVPVHLGLLVGLLSPRKASHMVEQHMRVHTRKGKNHKQRLGQGDIMAEAEKDDTSVVTTDKLCKLCILVLLGFQLTNGEVATLL